MEPRLEPGEYGVLPPEQSSDFVTHPGHYPTIPDRRDPESTWGPPPDVDLLPDPERCRDTWEFGRHIGKVQCSREDGHDGHHYANGDNPFSIYYRWGTTSLEG